MGGSEAYCRLGMDDCCLDDSDAVAGVENNFEEKYSPYTQRNGVSRPVFIAPIRSHRGWAGLKISSKIASTIRMPNGIPYRV